MLELVGEVNIGLVCCMSISMLETQKHAETQGPSIYIADDLPCRAVAG